MTIPTSRVLLDPQERLAPCDRENRAGQRGPCGLGSPIPAAEHPNCMCVECQPHVSALLMSLRQTCEHHGPRTHRQAARPVPAQEATRSREPGWCGVSRMRREHSAHRAVWAEPCELGETWGQALRGPCERAGLTSCHVAQWHMARGTCPGFKEQKPWPHQLSGQLYCLELVTTCDLRGPRGAACPLQGNRPQCVGCASLWRGVKMKPRRTLSPR